VFESKKKKISTGPISFNIEDTLVGEESQLEKDLSWKNHVPYEALIIQLLKSYIHGELQTMMPSVYMTIWFETDMDVPVSLFIKPTGQVLRPLPWPPFKYPEKVYALEPCSEPEVPWAMARETSAEVAPTLWPQPQHRQRIPHFHVTDSLECNLIVQCAFRELPSYSLAD
jgi:hypothetical protein